MNQHCPDSLHQCAHAHAHLNTSAVKMKQGQRPILKVCEDFNIPPPPKKKEAAEAHWGQRMTLYLIV